MFQDVPPVELDEIVVTAARLPPAATDPAFSIVRLDETDLRGGTRIDQAITAVPAVSLFRRTSSLTANPTTQGVSLRAIAPSGAGRALVTLDGVPMNDPFGGWVLWSQLSPDALEGVDIIRGAGSGPYGAGALTGVVALRERDAGGVLDISTAERGGARLSAAGSLSTDRYGLTASMLFERTDGYVPVRGPAAGAADTPLAMESASAAVRLDAAAFAGATLSLRLGLYDESRESGIAGARAEASGVVTSATLARPPEEGWGWRAQLWRRTSDLSNTFASVEPDRSDTTLVNNQYETPAAGWGANMAARRAVGDAEWEVGADVRLNEGETRERSGFGVPTRERRAGGQTTVAGVYVDGGWTSGPWLLAGGVRLDHWRAHDGRRREFDLPAGTTTLELAAPDASGEVVTGRLAVRRRLGDGLAVRAATYAGFRPPTLNELHRPFRVGNDITEANAGLVPERLYGIEAGLAGGDRLSWSVTAFANRLEDAIVNVTLAEGPGVFPPAGFVPAGGVLRQRQNAGVIEATGLEAEIRWRVSNTLSVNAAASLTDAQVDGGSSAPQLTGLRPAQAPSRSALVSAEWRATPRLTLWGAARHEGRRFDDDLNSRVLDAATTVDLRADWRINRSAMVYVAADNLLDADVEVAETGDGVEGYGPPRTIRVGLRFTY